MASLCNHSGKLLHRGDAACCPASPIIGVFVARCCWRWRRFRLLGLDLGGEGGGAALLVLVRVNQRHPRASIAPWYGGNNPSWAVADGLLSARRRHLLPTLLAADQRSPQFMEWGWRVPFNTSLRCW
ncbi:hypothetical protein RKK42_31300 [Klebsiella pneumoniae]|nr:hypothetical protein [Klebsiella pneumoniae]